MEAKVMTRELTVQIIVTGYGEPERFTTTVYDAESGDLKTIKAPYSPDEHPEFNEEIGNEIYSWVQILADRFEEEE